ncbi:MAG: hypothetical protein ACRDPR_17330, partial [Nocardioidaceae bacterium]
GLVWSAPMLLTGKAAAQTSGALCCPEGTPVTVKVASMTGVNCGVSCLDNLADVNFDCPADLVDCLGELELVVADFTSGGADTATIVLSPGVTLIAASAKASNRCYFTKCDPCFTSSPTDFSICKNFCQNQNGSACTGVSIPPQNNRIWVIPNAPNPGFTTIMVNTHPAPDGVLNHVELSLCVAPEITALCP